MKVRFRNGKYSGHVFYDKKKYNLGTYNNKENLRFVYLGFCSRVDKSLDNALDFVKSCKERIKNHEKNCDKFRKT